MRRYCIVQQRHMTARHLSRDDKAACFARRNLESTKLVLEVEASRFIPHWCQLMSTRFTIAGIGRGIALQLGEAGATVYITGREPKLSLQSDQPELPTLQKTADGS